MGALKMRTELLNVGSLLAKEARGMEEQPLYRSTVFETEDTGDYDRANCGERYLYDRIGAPNRDCLGRRFPGWSRDRTQRCSTPGWELSQRCFWL